MKLTFSEHVFEAQKDTLHWKVDTDKKGFDIFILLEVNLFS